jgi:hypothetical protein
MSVSSLPRFDQQPPLRRLWPVVNKKLVCENNSLALPKFLVGCEWAPESSESTPTHTMYDGQPNYLGGTAIGKRTP